MDEVGRPLRCGDPEWTRLLHKAFCEVLEVVGEPFDFAVSEQYANPPIDLVPTNGELGWTCRIVAGAVDTFEATPSTDVDVHVSADYNTAAELASYLVNGDPGRMAGFEKLCERAMDEGRLRVVGDLGKGRPSLMWGVHDTMARAMRDNTKGPLK